MTKKAILFTNWTKTDFSHAWDKVQYDFPAGQSMLLESHLANHFARHLAIREQNNEGASTNMLALKPLIDKCLSGVAVEAADDTELETKINNVKATSKGKDKEEEFPDLREDSDTKNPVVDKKEVKTDKK